MANVVSFNTGSISAVKSANREIEQSLKAQIQLTKEAQRQVVQGGAVNLKETGFRPVGAGQYVAEKLGELRNMNVTRGGIKQLSRAGSRGYEILMDLASGNVYGAASALEKLSRSRAARWVANTGVGRVLGGMGIVRGASQLAVGAGMAGMAWSIGHQIGTSFYEHFAEQRAKEVQDQIELAARLQFANSQGMNADTARQIKLQFDKQADAQTRKFANSEFKILHGFDAQHRLHDTSYAQLALSPATMLSTMLLKYEMDKEWAARNKEAVAELEKKAKHVFEAIEKDAGLEGTLRSEAMQQLNPQDRTEERIRTEVAKLVVGQLQALEAHVKRHEKALADNEKMRTDAVEKNPSLRSIWRDQARYFKAVEKDQLAARNDWSSY